MSEDDHRVDERNSNAQNERESGSGLELGGFDRRRYLQALGAAGLLGLGAGGASAAPGDWNNAGGETADPVEVPGEGVDWEAAADARIREHRTANLTVEVTDGDGNPVDADVSVEMSEHDYTFGTAVNAGTLVDDTEPGDDYRERIPELYNQAVLENNHKWRFWLENTELADTATRWLLDEGLGMRGHVPLWAAVGSYAVPPEVVRAMGVEWEDGGVTDPELDPDYVYQRTTEHVPEIINHYDGMIEEWEVYNEPIHQTGFVEAINGGEISESADFEPWTAPVISEWFDLASQAVSDDVTLATNEYNVLTGPYEETRQRYREYIEFLLDNGIDIGSIGLQSHFNGDSALTPTQILEGLNSYTGYGADLKITEFDTADENWSAEAKGEFLYQFLKTTFSHPATATFMMWGFWDGRHWRDDAPLFFEDWTPKPGYDAYVDLVFDQWWTDASGSTGESTYQIDLVAGSVEEQLGESEDDYYGRQNRLIQYAHTADGEVTERDTWINSLDPETRDAVTAGDIKVEDGTASVSFTVAKGEELTLSLAAYTLPDGEFSFDTAGEQRLVATDGHTFGPGEHTLEAELPSADGFTTPAFLGEHEVTVSVDGEEYSTTVTVDEPGDRTVTLRTSDSTADVDVRLPADD